MALISSLDGVTDKYTQWQRPERPTSPTIRHGSSSGAGSFAPFGNTRFGDMMAHRTSGDSIRTEGALITHAGRSDQSSPISEQQKTQLHDCTKGVLRRHNDDAPFGDLLRHHGKMASDNAVMFLNDLNTILAEPSPVVQHEASATARAATKPHLNFGNDQIASLFSRYLSTVPHLDTAESPHKDMQTIAIAATHKIFKKADKLQSFTPAQLHLMGEAVANIIGELDKTPHLQSFSSNFKHGATKALDAGFRTERALPKHLQWLPTYTVTMWPALVLAAPAGMVEAGKHALRTEDKTANHALRLLTSIVERIPAGKLEKDLFTQCYGLVFNARSSDRSTDLLKAIKACAKPEQKKELEGAVR
jgi:hypothetical protein